MGSQPEYRNVNNSSYELGKSYIASYVCCILNTIMKVTALIPDELVKEVKKVSGGKNITESLIIALKFYLNSRRLDKTLEQIEKEPMQFNEDFTAYGIRQINRNR